MLTSREVGQQTAVLQSSTKFVLQTITFLVFILRFQNKELIKVTKKNNNTNKKKNEKEIQVQ